MHLFLLLLRQEIMRHHWKKLQKQDLFFVLSQLDTNFFYYGILLHFIIGRIIGDLIPRTRNLQTKFRVNRNRRLSILSFYQSDELVGRITVHRTSFQLIQRTRYCLSPDDLACRRYQRRQTCIHTHLGDQRHCFFQQVQLS